jgi:hypothetical protein
MPRFKISYTAKDPEEVEADGYEDEGVWLTFTRKLGAGTTADPHRNVQVLRIKSQLVERIEATDLSE